MTIYGMIPSRRYCEKARTNVQLAVNVLNDIFWVADGTIYSHLVPTQLRGET